MSAAERSPPYLGAGPAGGEVGAALHARSTIVRPGSCQSLIPVQAAGVAPAGGSCAPTVVTPRRLTGPAATPRNRNLPSSAAGARAKPQGSERNTVPRVGSPLALTRTPSTDTPWASTTSESFGCQIGSGAGSVRSESSGG